MSAPDPAPPDPADRDPADPDRPDPDRPRPDRPRPRSSGPDASGPDASGPERADPERAVPELAVIVPHRDDAERLARCLEGLARSDLARAEVVVVDNASPVPPTAALARHPFARLVVEPAPGAAAARNRGVAETSAPVLLFLDADCVPAPGWVGAARAALARAGAPDVVGGRVEVFHEAGRAGGRDGGGHGRGRGRGREGGTARAGALTGAQAFEAVFAFDNRAYVERDGFTVTANMATTRAAFEAVGPFRGDRSEDMDWCFRAGAAGLRIGYEDEMRVAHPSRPDWDALERKWRRITAERWGLSAGRPGRRARRAAGALAMPVSAAAHLPRLARHPGLTPRERLGAAATLVRLRLRRAGWMLRQAAGRPI